MPAIIKGIIRRKVLFFNPLAAPGCGNPVPGLVCNSPGIWDQFVQITSSPDWLAQNILNILKTLELVDFNTAKLLAG